MEENLNLEEKPKSTRGRKPKKDKNNNSDLINDVILSEETNNDLQTSEIKEELVSHSVKKIIIDIKKADEIIEILESAKNKLKTHIDNIYKLDLNHLTPEEFSKCLTHGILIKINDLKYLIVKEKL